MNQPMGLRERKKERTRETIAETAIRLFLDKGFDRVSITEIAEAAEVSRRTLFTYFPTKEDLVLQRFADHESEAARIVRTRPAGQPPLDALREAMLKALAQRDPNTGLNDDPEFMAFLRLILSTESLAARLMRYMSRGIDALAEALREAGADPLVARLVACQVIVVQRELAELNHACLTGGESADARYPEAVRAAQQAFDLLRDGLGPRG
ncbi:AcrR family transcriptional regulator [Streptomyces griseochromogenes]|uniref:AcrR family transcriptional regulator n=1 Tax=Streptomyces griseochromogenes TaxID=68214 RepID=A0A1B1AWY4_9ACTN|nr:TetR family transcriptional regulator [Streptomyces griseochromogenes]ANP51030.1 TetR family transcriptional regulator [Streptomyces griseochromogenes]MBP2052036.1 AcrR family transcriptional regulator [Streptomyces griseochromogenes]